MREASPREEPQTQGELGSRFRQGGGRRESLPDFLWLYLCGSRASSIVKGILRDVYAD